MATLLEWTTGGATVALEIDVTPSQGYEVTSEVTEHPVEDGSAIADNVKPNNPSYTLEGLISNAPVIVPTTQMQGATRSLQVVTFTVGGREVQASVRKWSAGFDRVRECDALLENLVLSRQIVRLTTGLRQVENLIVTRYKVDRTSETGDALPVTLEFKRLRLASVQRVTVPAVRRGQLLDSRGPQPAVPNNSLLMNLRNSGASALRNALGLRS